MRDQIYTVVSKLVLPKYPEIQKIIKIEDLGSSESRKHLENNFHIYFSVIDDITDDKMKQITEDVVVFFKMLAPVNKNVLSYQPFIRCAFKKKSEQSTIFVHNYDNEYQIIVTYPNRIN